MAIPTKNLLSLFIACDPLLHFVEFENSVRFDIMKMGCPIFVRPINGQKLQLFELQLFISAREERLELPTLGFGDRCSTN